MGDCRCHRLFCAVKKIFLQYLPDGVADRISLPGVRAYKSRICSFKTEFWRSVEDASFYLSHYDSDHTVFCGPLCLAPQKKEGAEDSGNSRIGFDDSFLCMENVPVFSGGAADELLQV